MELFKKYKDLVNEARAELSNIDNYYEMDFGKLERVIGQLKSVQKEIILRGTKLIESNDLIVEVLVNPKLPKDLTFHNISDFRGERDIELLSEHLPLVDGVIVYADIEGNAVYFNGYGARARVTTNQKIFDEFLLFYNRHCRIYVPQKDTPQLEEMFTNLLNKRSSKPEKFDAEYEGY